MLPKLNIIFQNNFKVFSPGQTVSGYVELFISQPVTCKALSIKLFGAAQVNFKDRESSRTFASQNVDPNEVFNQVSDNGQTELVDYINNEEYYSLTYKLWGDGMSHHRMTPGRRQFPFSFVLPTHIPSSFESKFGFIRHTIDTWLVFISPVVKTVTFSSPISVMAEYDLNSDPLAFQPISLAEEKVLYNLMFKSGPISFTVNIDRSGYVPGENIIINAVCSNKSNKEMVKSKAAVVQITEYKAQGKTKTVENIVCFKEHLKLPAGGDNIWDSESLLIPNLPPSHLPGCNIMDVKYMFVFQFIPSGLSITLESQTDLVIGSIPLHTATNQSTSNLYQGNYLGSQIHEPTLPPYMPNNMPYSHVAPANPGYMEGASAPPIGFDGLEIYPPFPPSYEDSMRGSQIKSVTLEDFQYDFSDDEDGNLSSKPGY